MVHVSSVDEALAWYEQAFPNAVRARVNHPEFEFLMVGSARIELVQADSKVASGACGSVVYWAVPHFESALRRFLDLGADLYRGTIDIEDGQIMCQVRDPWGNCVGLRGPGDNSQSNSG